MAKELIELILNKEFQDMKKNIANEAEKTMLEIINKEGDVIIPLKKKINFDAIKESLKKTKYFNNNFEDSENYINCNEFMTSHISDKVKILNEVDLVKFLKIFTKELYTNPKFYGCIITDKKNFYLNVSHPLILKYLKDNKFKNLPEKFTALFFETKENEKINDDVFSSAFQRHVIFTKLYSNLVKNIECKIKIADEYISHESLFYIDSNIRIQKNLEIDDMLIPTQIATKGEMVPWYGYAMINQNGYGFSSVDFVTGNISADSGWSSSGAEICTGDYNRKTLDGWYTLSKINLNSMYHSYVINKKTWFESLRAAIEIDKLILENKESDIF